MNIEYPIRNQQLYEKTLKLLNDKGMLNVNSIEFDVNLGALEYNFRYMLPQQNDNKLWYDITDIYDGLGNWRSLKINEEGDLRVFYY